MPELTERDLARVIAEHRYADRGLTGTPEEIDIEICTPLARAVLAHIETIGETRYGVLSDNAIDEYFNRSNAEADVVIQRASGSDAELVKRATVATAWTPVAGTDA